MLSDCMKRTSFDHDISYCALDGEAKDACSSVSTVALMNLGICGVAVWLVWSWPMELAAGTRVSLCSLSSGRRASIETVSSVIPKNWIVIQGHLSFLVVKEHLTNLHISTYP